MLTRSSSENPSNLLSVLGKAQIHVPFELLASGVPEDAVWKGQPVKHLSDLQREFGATEDAYLCSSAFWIVHHDAIETVYEVAMGFRNAASERGSVADVSTSLGFTMQILGVDPESRLISRRPDLWAPVYGTKLEASAVGKPFGCSHPLACESCMMDPAIIHLGRAGSEPVRKSCG